MSHFSSIECCLLLPQIPYTIVTVWLILRFKILFRNAECGLVKFPIFQEFVLVIKKKKTVDTLQQSFTELHHCGAALMCHVMLIWHGNKNHPGLLKKITNWSTIVQHFRNVLYNDPNKSYYSFYICRTPGKWWDICCPGSCSDTDGICDKAEESTHKMH